VRIYGVEWWRDGLSQMESWGITLGVQRRSILGRLEILSIVSGVGWRSSFWGGRMGRKCEDFVKGVEWLD